MFFEINKEFKVRNVSVKEGNIGPIDLKTCLKVSFPSHSSTGRFLNFFFRV